MFLFPSEIVIDFIFVNLYVILLENILTKINHHFYIYKSFLNEIANSCFCEKF